MARKKAGEARDAAGSGDDTSAVLTDERSQDPSAETTDTDDAVSLDEGAREDETDVESDEVDTHEADDDASDEAADDADDEAVDTDDDVDVDELDDDDEDDEDDDRRHYVGRGAFFATLGGAIVAVLAVLFLLGAFVWPKFLGPGSPESTGNEAVSALGAKDPARLGQISCVRLDGTPAASFPPELLALVGNAAPAGAPKQTLDTEARVPVDLTLTQGGQSQTLPADLLLNVTDGDWCLNGISQRQ